MQKTEIGKIVQARIRVVVLEQDDAALKALHSAVHVEHSLAEISDSNFFGLSIKHAYLITSKKDGDDHFVASA